MSVVTKSTVHRNAHSISAQTAEARRRTVCLSKFVVVRSFVRSFVGHAGGTDALTDDDDDDDDDDCLRPEANAQTTASKQWGVVGCREEARASESERRRESARERECVCRVDTMHCKWGMGSVTDRRVTPRHGPRL